VRITLTARVDLSGGWDQNSVSKEIRIETEHTDNDPGLPWAQICAGLVEATIQERLHSTEDPEENEE